uniref:NADH-ubiquinone oxidoreductase chain 4 n=1 Tax=Prionobrama filigera TaxID=1180191 RepID=A0A7S6VG29_9TELE|nr:NADH dehydrogenase subunit 4 [Prionobrama filigera]
MLMTLTPMFMLLLSIWLSPKKWLWMNSTVQSLFIAITSLFWLKWYSEPGWVTSNYYLAVDQLSAPLLILSCWLLPLMIIASQNHIKMEPANRQRMYISLLTSLHIFLILAFSATEVILFYVMFEATLIPTLVIITRWGNQSERLNAGAYFLFYTLASSLPLLVSLLLLKQSMNTLSMMMFQFSQPTIIKSWGDNIWVAGCLIAFLVKMPLYGVHLWLPKAHVEAPVAGSMVLAAILLKLGGYGMIRLMMVLSPLPNTVIYPLVLISLWGVIMTSSTCLRQTDLKSLIAYSSVSHMCLVAAGILIQTPWGLTGAMMLMIAHGLVSSCLFCLANTTYERTHNRTLLLARGMQIIFPLTTSWWFIANLANLALPPLPNFVGELFIITALFNWSPWTIILTGLGTLITATYSLHLFLTSQRGPTPPHIPNLQPFHTREHLLITLHLAPMILLILKPEIVMGPYH